VLSDCSIDCSSPMSAKTCRPTVSAVPNSAGTCSPAWAMRVSSPTVFSAMVFPPVFGPVIRMVETSSPSTRSIGTT